MDSRLWRERRRAVEVREERFCVLRTLLARTTVNAVFHQDTSTTHKKDTPFGMSFLWWAEVDSNHRSRRRQIYSLIHLATLESAHIQLTLVRCGAGDWTRTHNLLITNQLLCQLSYTGVRLVPWGGIEPPTGRFSVCCSTD